MTGRPGTSKPPGQRSTRAGNSKEKEKEKEKTQVNPPKRAGAADADMDEATQPKIPSMREQLTSAYEAKVIMTKATRDPRLLKSKNYNTNLYENFDRHPQILIKPYQNNTHLNLYPKTYLLPYPTYPRSPIGRPNANLRMVEEQKRLVLSQQGVPKPKKYSEAPVMNLKDLLPAGLD